MRLSQRHRSGGGSGGGRRRPQDRHQVRPARPGPEGRLEYTGFDVDVATYVANQLGTRGRDISSSRRRPPQRETLIHTGQVDYIVGTYSITDARKEKVSFAGPYFIAGQDLLVRADDTRSPARTP